MAFLDRLKSLNPVRLIDKEIREAVEDKAHAATQAVVSDLAKLSPELMDLLSGEEIVVEIRVRLKQKGEA